MDIHCKCDFLSLKAIIYKGEFMEDCPVENQVLDGILKICFGNYKEFYHIRRRGTSIKLFLI
jgi:hypothetical protein